MYNILYVYAYVCACLFIIWMHIYIYAYITSYTILNLTRLKTTHTNLFNTSLQITS